MSEISSWGVRELVAPQYFWREEPAGRLLQQMQKLARRYGLTFAAAHGLLGAQNDMGCADSQAIAEHRSFLTELGGIGIRTYTIHSGAQHLPESNVESPDRSFYVKVRDSLEQLIPTAEQHDITLALENIYEPLPVLKNLVRIVEEIDHPRLGFCLDTGHANVNGAGVKEIFSLLAPRLVTCHLHDNDGVQDQHAAPGQGNLDWQWLAAKIAPAHRGNLCHLETETRTFSLEIWQDFQKIFQAVAIMD